MSRGRARETRARARIRARAMGEWKDLVLDIERYKDRGHHRLK